MESPHRTEHGKEIRSQTGVTGGDLSGFHLDCVRTILNMAYAAP